TRVELPDGSVVKYGYDAFSRRIRKETSESTTVYVWAGHQLVQEIVGHGAEQYTREYLYAPGSHTPLALRHGDAVFYYHNDSLGTPQLLTDAFGSVAWSARYDSFGTATVELARVSQPLRFAGQHYDPETGLQYNRARYYDPRLGTYLSRDPDAPVGGVNHYVYVGADPVNGVDPLGLFFDSLPSLATVASVAGGVVVGLAIGAAVVALAPAAIVGATVFGIGGAIFAGIVAGGIAGGAAGGAIGAAMTGGCVPCAALKGAAIGFLGAFPFVAAEAAALTGAAAIGAFAAAGAVAGAIGYVGDVATSDRKWDWGDLGTAVLTGAALGGLGKWIGGKIGASEEAPSAEKGTQAPEGPAKPTSEPAPRRPLTPEESANAQEIGKTAVKNSGGSVRKGLAEVNSQDLSQEEAAKALQGMYEASGRKIGEVVPDDQGNLVVLSRNSGKGQPVNIIDPDGKISFGKADIQEIDVNAVKERVAAEPDPQKRIDILKEPRQVTNVQKDENP
ncbi:MAG TPA: RHS repeat-associated core domain-containing protein, partial [Polyangiaceae bacterium]